MQDNLPDLPASASPQAMQAGLPKQKPSFLQRLKGVGADDKRLVKLIIFIGFGVLLLLGIAAAVLEQVAPRNGAGQPKEELFSSGLWQIQPQPNQIILGFFVDENGNDKFDYQERPFDKVTAAIRRAGETEPFRRVSAGSDGLVKIDDLARGSYEISLDNYVEPEAGDWLFFEDYQQNREFLPTAWRPVTLSDEGYQELIGITFYRPPLLLALETTDGVSWYDPERARVFAESNFPVRSPAGRGNDIFYLQEDKLKKLNWASRAATEELIWLEDAGSDWQLSPQGKTVAYLTEGELRFRSRDEACNEGSLLWEGVRPEVTGFSFIAETVWLVVGRPDQDRPRQLFKLDCRQAEPITTLAEPVSAGALAGGDWFYSTDSATYLVDSGSNRPVKYIALGGGGGIIVSQDRRYLLKKLASGNWLVVDYPAVKTSGVEKHYLLTGVVGEPTLVNDDVYYVRSKPCEADGDCGEVVKIKLEGSGVWSVDAVWDLKNVPAVKVLGVVK